jgi:hypothetical protein
MWILMAWRYLDAFYDRARTHTGITTTGRFFRSLFTCIYYTFIVLFRNF